MTGGGHDPDRGSTGSERLRAAEAALDVSPSRARPLLQAVVDDFSETDPASAAGAAYTLARLSVIGARPRHALDWIDRARLLFGRAGLAVPAARTDLGRINVLNELGRHQEAVTVGLELIGLLSGRTEHDEEVEWILAGAAENTGVSHGWLGQHNEALTLYDRALGIYQRLGDLGDRARVSANRGVELLELGRHVEAVDLLNGAARDLEATGDELEVVRCLVYRAKGYALAGRYGDAIDSLAEADARLGPLEQSQDHLRTSLMWAEVYSVLNLTDEALARCHTLIPLFDEAGMTRDAGMAELVAATVLARSGDKAAAIAACTAAEDRVEQAGLTALTARCRLLRSELVEPELAELLAKEAFDRLVETGHAAEAAEAALRCAELSSVAGWADANRGPAAPDPVRSDQASSYLAEAVALIDRHRLDGLAWRVHVIRGRWAEEAGREGTAEAHYQQALSSLRGLRSTITSDRVRIPFMGRARTVQEALVFLLLRLGDIAGAEEVTESERAHALVQRMSAKVSARSGRPRYPDGPSAVTTMTYQTLDEEIVCFIRRSDEADPLLVRTKVTVPEIEALLRKLDAQWRRLEDPRLAVHEATLRRSTDRILQDLYLGLFEPAEIHLRTGDSLMVAPTETLANIPFHALHDGLSYLIERYEITVTPSVTVATYAAGHRLGRHTVVVGIEDEMAPEIKEEVAQIAALTGGELLTGTGATIENVRSRAETADVIHLATHGQFRHDNPWFSAIRLADGWVRAIDIEEWDLDGALVVLAACRSGQQSGVGGGDELLGIPRACLAAGAAAVVVNLWPVDDRHSVGLMTDFHRRLRTTAPPRALREAQRSAMERSPHPYHWAPAILYGSRPSASANLDDERPTHEEPE